MTQVLLLNASYEPLAVITRQRALSLMARGRVEATCQEAIEIRGVFRSLQIPVVIRLRRYINVPRRGARWSRRGVFARDKYTCAYCGLQSGEKQGGKRLARQNFSIDHVIPISRGGKNTWVNTVCACRRCNQRKADRTPHEANMRLLWEPKLPRVSYLVLSGQVPSAWKVYLEL